MTYTRSQILENRRKAVEYLQRPHLRKAVAILQDGKNSRCCLGHMCYALDIPAEKIGRGLVKYDGQEWEAPVSLIDKIGLFDSVGEYHEAGMDKDHLPSKFFGPRCDANALSATSLACINDETRTSPQRIGKWLEMYIEGGPGTPFRPLSEYPE